MDPDKFRYCVTNKRLPLTNKEYLFHYQVSLFFLGFSLISFCLMFSVEEIEFHHRSLYFFLVFVAVSTLLYFIQKRKLKFLVISTILDEKQVAEVIDRVASNQEWRKIRQTKSYYLSKSDDDFFRSLYGEQITILYFNNKIYYNCICDLKKRFTFSSFGRRWFHKRTFLQILKLMEEEVRSQSQNKVS